ncbi:MAG: ribose 5-phosphate isomerase B [Coriobacteriales bacterium]|jgi:ribose 5-phosphate isomerase B|nr:ribose 5-phosphate isomerase B [Coriobacteriales bacterium]
MLIAIASDHGGFDQKEQLAAFIRAGGNDVLDLGPATSDTVDYADYAVLVAQAVADGMADKGVLVCGTGIGMSMAANKIPGIRAANVTTPQFAALAREHNDANVLALSGRFVDLKTNCESLTAFLDTPFAQGRHSVRVDKINALDK